MTFERAIEILNPDGDNVWRGATNADLETVKEACRLTIEALDRMTKQKPDIEGDGYDDKGELIYDTLICPCCGKEYEMEYDDYKHCPNCGQAIDWR